jgi:hypothetical protein
MEPDVEKGDLASFQIREAREDRSDGSSNRKSQATSSLSRRRRRSSSGSGSIRPGTLDNRHPDPENLDIVRLNPENLDRIRLNPENPGPWVLHRHKRGLLVEIEKPKSNIVSKMCKYLKHWTESPCGTTPEERHDDLTAEGDERRFRVSFAELQRMQLRKLQCTLVRDAVKMHYSDEESGEWEKTLRQYGKYCPRVN